MSREKKRNVGARGFTSPLNRNYNPNEAQTRDPNDFYRTPEVATLSILSREHFGQTIWEPCCGDGAISRVLKAAGYKVYSSDLIDRGYGHVADFLTPTRRMVDSIVTNPPFSLAEQIVRKALQCTTFKVAMFLRLSFLESARRYPLFQETPLKTVYVFSNRLSLYPGDQPNRGGGSLAFAWFIWEHSYVGKPQIDWILRDTSGLRIVGERITGEAKRPGKGLPPRDGDDKPVPCMSRWKPTTKKFPIAVLELGLPL
jgi:hypothetical protein